MVPLDPWRHSRGICKGLDLGGFTPPLNTRIFCSKLCTIDLGGSSRLLDSLCTAYMCCNEKELDLSILCRLNDARDLSERTVRIIQDDSGSCLLEL